MLGKKAKSRILLFVTLFISFALVIFFVLRSLEENVVYFLSPSDVYNKSDISLNETIRIGGLVKINSINEKEEVVNFIITDLKNEIVVSYSGLMFSFL